MSPILSWELAFCGTVVKAIFQESRQPLASDIASTSNLDLALYHKSIASRANRFDFLVGA